MTVQGEYIFYVFAEDTPGVIKCGLSPVSVQEATEVGFEPQWVLLKPQQQTGNWIICDNKRSDGSGQTAALYPDDNRLEDAYDYITFNSTGFTNNYADNCIYVAIAVPPTRSQTNEEFVETTAKFLTYDNRKQVKEGEEALSDREELEDALIKRGLTKDHITKLFND